MLATRISRLVASRRLTFSVVSTQGIKSQNFAFDFNKKLNSCLVESAHCYQNLAAAMFTTNENHRPRETGTNGSGLERAIWPLVRAWLLEGFALVCEKEVASCSVFKLRELYKLHDNLMPLYMRA